MLAALDPPATALRTVVGSRGGASTASSNPPLSCARFSHLGETETQVLELLDVVLLQLVQTLVAESDDGVPLTLEVVRPVRVRAVKEVELGRCVGAESTTRRFKGTVCKVTKQE